MLFRQTFGPHNLTSRVERIGRVTVLRPQADRRTRPIRTKLVAGLGSLPVQARRLAPFDRGSEVLDWPHLQAHAGVQAWFCDPRSPWQKGTVENTNRRMWRWLPRDIDPTTISGSQLKAICDRLNATPRKCLGWRTPSEVFCEKVLDRRA